MGFLTDVEYDDEKIVVYVATVQNGTNLPFIPATIEINDSEAPYVLQTITIW